MTTTQLRRTPDEQLLLCPSAVAALDPEDWGVWFRSPVACLRSRAVLT